MNVLSKVYVDIRAALAPVCVATLRILRLDRIARIGVTAAKSLLPAWVVGSSQQQLHHHETVKALGDQEQAQELQQQQQQEGGQNPQEAAGGRPLSLCTFDEKGVPIYEALESDKFAKIEVIDEVKYPGVDVGDVVKKNTAEPREPELVLPSPADELVDRVAPVVVKVVAAVKDTTVDMVESLFGTKEEGDANPAEEPEDLNQAVEQDVTTKRKESNEWTTAEEAQAKLLKLEGGGKEDEPVPLVAPDTDGQDGGRGSPLQSTQYTLQEDHVPGPFNDGSAASVAVRSNDRPAEAPSTQKPRLEESSGLAEAMPTAAAASSESQLGTVTEPMRSWEESSEIFAQVAPGNTAPGRSLHGEKLLVDATAPVPVPDIDSVAPAKEPKARGTGRDKHVLWMEESSGLEAAAWAGETATAEATGRYDGDTGDATKAGKPVERIDETVMLRDEEVAIREESEETHHALMYSPQVVDDACSNLMPTPSFSSTTSDGDGQRWTDRAAMAVDTSETWSLPTGPTLLDESSGVTSGVGAEGEQQLPSVAVKTSSVSPSRVEHDEHSTDTSSTKQREVLSNILGAAPEELVALSAAGGKTRKVEEKETGHPIEAIVASSTESPLEESSGLAAAYSAPAHDDRVGNEKELKGEPHDIAQIQEGEPVQSDKQQIDSKQEPLADTAPPPVPMKHPVEPFNRSVALVSPASAASAFSRALFGPVESPMLSPSRTPFGDELKVKASYTIGESAKQQGHGGSNDTEDTEHDRVLEELSSDDEETFSAEDENKAVETMRGELIGVLAETLQVQVPVEEELSALDSIVALETDSASSSSGKDAWSSDEDEAFTSVPPFLRKRVISSVYYAV